MSIGKICLRFDELPSTNDFARELLSQGRPAEGTVVRAENQTAGRGQPGTRWESAPGQNLTLSVIFYPAFLRATEQFRLNEAVSLAVRDCCGDWISPGFFQGQKTETRPPQTEIKIKWPNDLYLGDRKAAGILIQNAIAGDFLTSAVVGIGLNVNQRIFRSDAPNPTSLATAAGHDFDLDAVALSLFKHLETRYLQLKSGPRGIALARAEYRQSLFRLDQRAAFAGADGTVFFGKIRGTADDGRLRVETDDEGVERLFGLREIRFARP